MDRFKNAFRIPSARLANWDYGSHGLYFVTICTKEKVHFFGEVNFDALFAESETQNIASLHYTEIGEIANQYWQKIPKHFPFAELDEYIIMPNHLHGILFLNKPNHEQWQPNSFGPQSQNLASIIRGYKAAVKKHTTLHQVEFAWQPRYYDRVIRSEKELQNIRQYIFNNPSKWEKEKNNPENLLM